MAEPKNITDANFNDEVLASDTPVLVDFWAPWCGPCQRMSPILDEIAKDYDGRLVVAKLNIDDNPMTARSYSVISIPTMMVFVGGERKATIVGGKPKVELAREIDAALA